MRPNAPTLEYVSDSDARTTDIDSSDREACLVDIYGCKFVCLHKGCKLQFKRQDDLDHHEYAHTGIRKHICPVDKCRKEYVTLSHLKRHNRTAHAAPKSAENADVQRIPCPTPNCPKSFTNRTSMLRHQKTAHLLPKQHKCEHCPEAFQHKNQLRRHLPIHTGKFPYQCQHCPQGFANLRQMTRHKTTHRIGKTSEYKCGDCSNVFGKWSELVSHRRLKHPFMCSICDREFASRASRKAHMNRHNTEGSVFECPHDECPKYYTMAKNLRWHIRMKHSPADEAILFECDMCGRSLSTKQKMVDHLAWHIRCPDGGRKISQPKTGADRKPRQDKGIPRFSMASRLTNVIEQNIPEYRFECDVCAKLFNSRWEINRHLLSVHFSQTACGAQQRREVSPNVDAEISKQIGEHPFRIDGDGVDSIQIEEENANQTQPDKTDMFESRFLEPK